MLTPLVGLLLIAADGDASLVAETRLIYRGTVARVDRDRSPTTPEKHFDLTWLVTRADDDGAIAYAWIVDERGAGGFGWSDRCGRWSQDAAGAPVGPNGPALSFDYGTGRHVVPLSPPRFALPDGADTGTKWERDDTEFEIVRATTVGDRRAWEIQASSRLALVRRLWVEPESGLVVRRQDRVFMNQGTEYDLAIELVEVAALAEPEAKELAAGVTALVKLRGKLKLPPRGAPSALSAAQLETLAAELPGVKAAAERAGATAKIVAEAERDLVRQSDRSTALERLTAQQIGRTVEPFEASGLGDFKLTAAELRDRVTVLHFWDYRDAPLAEPYGQVGYLEFLYGRRKAAGVRVVGVAVDGRFAQQATSAAAASGVRRLKNFMNLTYPIIYDDGALLRRFGDPRTIGADLPLFVVAAPDGTVAHYKTGFYEVDRETGLKQLDEVVESLLKKDDEPANK